MKYVEKHKKFFSRWIKGGGIDHSTVQSEEMWTGVRKFVYLTNFTWRDNNGAHLIYLIFLKPCHRQVTYGLAGLMISEGLLDEGLRTAEGVYRWECFPLF